NEASSSSISFRRPPPCFAASRTDAVAVSALVRSLTVPTTVAPCETSERAVSSPIPDEAPVTRNRLPVRLMPASTSSAVVVAPNFLLIFIILDWMGKRKQAYLPAPASGESDAYAAGYVNHAAGDIAGVGPRQEADERRHFFKCRDATN